MCGIIGFLNLAPERVTNTVDFLKSFRSLTRAVEQRGKHACGYLHSRGGTVYFKKHSTSVTNFLKSNSRRYSRIILNSDTVCFHSRQATKGSPSKNENNHPHICNNRRFALIHNGTLQRDLKPLKFLSSKVQSDCDSEYFVQFVSMLVGRGWSIEKAFSKFMELIYGSFALVLYDTAKKVIYFYRDSERPMYIVDYGKFLLFGSTLPILDSFVTSYKVRKPSSYFNLDTMRILSFDMVKRELSYAGVVPSKKARPNYGYYNHYSMYDGY